MKQIVANYTFNKTARTVTFTDFGTIRLDRILLITNVTTNTIIYNFADATKGGTVATNVLTLTYDTTAMSNTDKLQIFYDSTTGDPTYDPGTPLPTGAATETTLSSLNTKTPTVGQKTAASSSPVVIASDQSAVPVSLGANQSVNVAQINGVATTMGSGNSGTGVQRVVLATDQPALTNAQPMNMSQVAATTTAVNNGPSSAGTQRVTIASDSTGNIATIGTSVTPGTAATNLGKAVDSAAGATDTGVAALGLRDDVLTTLTPADGDYVTYRTDGYGSVWMHEGAVEVATPFNAALTDVDISVKASAGYLKSIFVSSKNAAVRYLHLFNKATAPAGGDTPVAIFELAAGSATVPSTLSLGRAEFGDGGYPFTVGVAVGVSTTAATFTAATTTDTVLFGMYV